MQKRLEETRLCSAGLVVTNGLTDTCFISIDFLINKRCNVSEVRIKGF